jgi:hypothetical protein
MDLAALERALGASEARPLLVDARLVRRVIKRHRHLPGMGLQVPHARSYAIDRAALLEIVDAKDLGRKAADLPERVILLPRPDRDEHASDAEALASLWRYAFHARVHQELEERAASGQLTPARIRERVHRIGQTEFDEIRRVLRQDDMLVAHEDFDVYAEFAALFLELSHFAPELLPEVFPTLAKEAVEAALAEDVDVERLLAATKPEGATLTRKSLAESEAPPEDESPVSTTDQVSEAVLAEAAIARGKGNAVRAALVLLRAGAKREARADLDALVARLARALEPQGSHHAPHAHALDEGAWKAALFALADRAARGIVFYRVEARVLYDLQSACLAAERAIGKVSLVDWALSLGKKPMARLLPATREIRVAAALKSAAKKLSSVRLASADRARLAALIADARHRAGESIRAALRPAIEETLASVGLRAESVPERVALAKVVEELLDHAAEHEFLSLGTLRDAVSRNQLKLGDVTVGELIHGDALLAADRKLADALDGVHRRGEIYLRGLQKLSSLLFGTGVGRFLSLYFLLPAGAAYVLLEGVSHMATPIGHLLHLLPHHHHVHLFTYARFAIAAVVIFSLVHSGGVRAACGTVLRGIGWVFAAIFYHLPRFVFTLPIVRAVLRSRAVLTLRRFVIKPGIIAAVAWATPVHEHAPGLAMGVAAGVFVGANLALNSRTGILVEELVLDALAATGRRLTRHVLPGLFRLIADFFRGITEALDRAIYTVDEWLRFREGQNRGVIAVKAVLGLFWFAIAYVVRIYINLLVEPQFNPIKHFPVVTVAAKIMLPMSGIIIEALTNLLAPVLGPITAKAIVGPTVFSLPGFFGFLVWELKENYKLYRASRPKELKPVAIGHHGETMAALLKPGLHSGTVPKLWTKLRRAAKKNSPAVEKHAEAMREIEEAVHRFAERELTERLAKSERWKGGAVHVAHVALASNRVRLELARQEGEDRAVIAFEEQSGFLVAGVASAGWSGALSDEDRVIFENALAGLYQLAGVDLVREQIAAALPAEAAYDVANEGLVVWPAGFANEVVYPLERGATLTPRVRGEAAGNAPGAIERKAIFFRESPIAWSAWVEAWSGEPKRVTPGAPILPR